MYGKDMEYLNQFMEVVYVKELQVNIGNLFQCIVWLKKGKWLSYEVSNVY